MHARASAFLTLLLLTSLASAQDAPVSTAEPLTEGSDYLCESSVYFTWQPNPPPVHKPEPGADATPPPPPEARKEFALTVSEQGMIQALVESRLKARIPAAEAQAVRICKTTHESQSSCVSGKLEQNKRQYAELDYAARRALLEAITADCKALLGRCLTSESTPVKCVVNRPPSQRDVPKPTEGEKAKEKGKPEPKKK